MLLAPLLSFSETQARACNERKGLNLPHLSPSEVSRIKTVNPQYPDSARELWQSETVVLDVVVGLDGQVEAVLPVENCCQTEIFQEAACSAVKQWVFRPFVLNGKPVRIKTRVTINFVLDENTKPLDVCVVGRNPNSYDGKLLNLVGVLSRENRVLVLSGPCKERILVAANLRLPEAGKIALRGMFERHKGPEDLRFDRILVSKVLNTP